MGTFQDTVKYLHRSGDGNFLQMVEVWLVLWSETSHSLVRLGMRTSGHQAVSTVGFHNGLTLPGWPKSLPISQPFHNHQNFLVILFLSSKNLQLIVLPQWLFRIWEAIGPLILLKLHSIELPWKEGQKKQNSDRRQEVEFTRANGEAFWMCYGFWRYLWVILYGSPLGFPQGCAWRS